MDLALEFGVDNNKYKNSEETKTNETTDLYDTARNDFVGFDDKLVGEP